MSLMAVTVFVGWAPFCWRNDWLIFPIWCARLPRRVIVYTGTSKLETRLDQTGAGGYAVGFQGLVQLLALNQLPQNEVIENALRKEVKLVPEIVIRELVANARTPRGLLR